MPSPPSPQGGKGEAGHKLEYIQGSVAGPRSQVAQDGQEVT